MAKVLVFDIKGEYAHFKKIYATTSAISYCIPPKTSLYGYIGAILGLEKENNAYLKEFANKQCLLGISVLKPIVMQRININLRPHTKGKLSASDNRKPTTMEFVYSPKYRIYFTHQNETLYQNLKKHLQENTAFYTPCLGIATCLSSFEWVGEFETEKKEAIDSVLIRSVIPRKAFNGFDKQGMYECKNEVIEQSMYAVEMDTQRNVTEREDILLDRKAKAVPVFVNYFYPIENDNVILF